mgnify:CR=1 FL=1
MSCVCVRYCMHVWYLSRRRHLFTAWSQSEMGAGPLAAQLVSCLAHFLTSGVEDDPAWGDDPMAYPDMDDDETLGEAARRGRPGWRCLTGGRDAQGRGGYLSV